MLTRKNTDSGKMPNNKSWSGKLLIRKNAKQENADHENDDQQNTDHKIADQKMLIRTSTDENNYDRRKR